MSRTMIREQRQPKGEMRVRPPIQPKNTNLRASLRACRDVDTYWHETCNPDWLEPGRARET